VGLGDETQHRVRAVRAEWWRQARCGAQGPGMFFADDAGRSAKALCAMCPVRGDCLAAGLEEPDGVWGGLGRADRRRLVGLAHRLACDPGHGDNARDVAKLLEEGAGPGQIGAVCGLSGSAVEALAAEGREAAGRGALPERVAAGDPSVRHGEPTTYNAGCRCQPCRAAMAAKYRARTARALHALGGGAS